MALGNIPIALVHEQPITSASGVQRTRADQKVPSIRRRRLVTPDHEAVKHSLHATIVKRYRELGAVCGSNCAVAELVVEHPVTHSDVRRFGLC